MKRIRQRKSHRVFLATLFTVAMTLGGAAALAPTSHLASVVNAANAVEYMAWDETSKTVKSVDGGCSEYTVVSNSTTAWTDGWYVVSGNVEIETRISVSGTANLILCDGTELKANAGIGLSNAEANINIYAQSTGDNAGKLTATGDRDNAGIGGSDDSPCGNIVISGGVINATGGEDGAGIGGGYNGPCGNITINGGVITAIGGDDGAGIGTNYGQCGIINIKGGTVTAKGSDYGAGIGTGFGEQSSVEGIVIEGGAVEATGGEDGAGIGTGYESKCGNINIKGGTVTAKGGENGSGIGTGCGEQCSVEGIVIEGGVVEATGGDDGAGIGTGFDGGRCGPIQITGGTITASGGSWAPGIGCHGWSANFQSITIANTVELLTVNKGSDAEFGIGIAHSDDGDGSCGPITIGGQRVDNISRSPFVFPVYHQVTFHTNGGEIVKGNITQYVEGIGATLPTAVTKDQFYFDGWYDNEDLTGEPVTEISADESGDLEFYAKWAKGLTITYHLNGGEWPGGISAPTTFKEGKRFVLFGPDSIIPVKKGYMFYGWFTSDTLDEESYIEFIREDETNDVEVWAAWGLYPVAPTIEDFFPTEGKTEYIGEAVTVTATANENGFVLDKTHSITITFEEGLFPDDGICLIVADEYNHNPQPEYITSEYEYNEQFLTSSWGEVYQGGYGDRDGDHFGPCIGAPWPFDFEAFDGSITVTLSEEYSEKSLAFKQIHLMAAHHVRTVTYNENGGTMPGEYPTNYLESRGLELAKPTRNGYAFKGWYESADFTGNPVTKITVADTGDKEYFAKWEFVEVVDLSKLTEDVTIYDGQTITGELKDNVKITIADGATVTLKDVTIEGENDLVYAFAGITLEGDATLILEGNNTVKGFYERFPGIYVSENKTLTIGGNGTLDASSNGKAAGIGAGRNVPCGNIVIEGGTINAIGGAISAGIGASGCSCGTITIKGGVVSATGGEGAAGIGGGEGSSCGDITITDKAKKVTATSGSGAPNSIGSGRDGDAVRVTIAGKVYEEGISDPNFVYNSATAEEFAALIEDLGTVEYSDEYKEKLEQAREMYDCLSDEEKEKVDAATLKVLTDAEVEYKNLDDGAKADETTDAIDNLPSNITAADKEAVEAARAAYDALSDDQKAKVDPETLAKLVAAEKEINDIETSNQVTETINNLPPTGEITPASKDAIEAARAAYEALSDEAKEKVSKETLDNLEAAELTLGIAIFDEEFDKVPASADQITSSDKEAIEAARAAYEALTDEQKTKFPQDKLEKLEEAETALAYVAFNEEFVKIPANSDDITSADKEAIEAARAAYNALNDEEKSKFPQDKLAKLEAAESALKVITVSETLDALPSSDDITAEDKEAIEAARAAYNALSDGQKEKVDPETLAKLVAAESALKVIAVSETLDALPSSDDITTADKEAIEAARAAYNALDDDQKEKVDPETLAKLVAAEKEIRDIEASSQAAETISNLPATDEITAADKEAVEAARAAYDALTGDQKAKVDPETLAKLVAAEKEISDIEASSQAAETISNLPATDEITAADKEAVEAARAAYDALTGDQKAKVDPETLAKLVAAEKEIRDIEASSQAAETISNLPATDEITAADKEAVEAARAAYDALTGDQKAKVAPEILERLLAAEKEINDIETSSQATETIDALPSSDDITIADKDAIEAARAAYDALSDEAKEKVSKETLDRLVAAEKEIGDIETSNQVTETISNLSPIDEITAADKEAIEAARAAYDALSEEAKGKVSKETLDRLVAAEKEINDIETSNQVIETIDGLPSFDEITAADKEAVEAARQAYDALTDDQKEKVDPETLDRLVAAEKEIRDIEASGQAAETISNLPATDDITIADKEAVEAARAAYDALSDDQKEKVDPETLAKLVAAEKEISDIETSSQVTETIDGLPSSDDITIADKEAVEAARAAYDALTDDQKEKVDPETLDRLVAAEKEIKDIEASSQVAETLDALPSSDDITAEDKETIEAARAAYDALTDDQKEKVDPETLAKLEEAESALEVIAVSETIDALPSSDDITTEDKEAIKAARAAYDALTDEEKTNVAPETLTKLKEAESALEVEEVIALIKNIGSVENNAESKEKIEAARAAYENLSEDQKTRIKEGGDLQTLVSAEKAYDDLVNPKSQAPVVSLVVVSVLLIPAVLMLAYLILYITKKKGSTVRSVVGLPVLLGAAVATGAFVALYVLAGLLVAVVVADVIIIVKNPQAIKDIKNFKQLFKKDAKNDPVATETAPVAPTQPVEATEPAAEETQKEVKAEPVAEKPASVEQKPAEIMARPHVRLRRKKETTD